MELNFTELDNIADQTPINSSNETHNYWEKPTNNSVKQPKKKVSFDDILSHMSLTVNKNGVLQSIVVQKDNKQDNSYNVQQEQYQQQPYQQQQQYEQQQYQQQPSKIQIKKQEPIDPAVKHSFIYNKYFKDYQDAAPVEQEVLVPKTKEEYFQMVNAERRRRIQEQYRISQIKSKKLLFTTNNSYNQINIKPTAHKLHKLSFN